jgi:hypothetical protein
MFEIIFIAVLIALSVFSWGFVDVHSSYPHIISLGQYATAMYVVLFALLFFAYLWVLRLVSQKKITVQKVFRYICMAAIILFLGFPGFSYDIFNYMATAKVTYAWHENPYIVMPIEISNEPMLTYMHAANKVALYGPVWIMISAIPHYLGFGNPLVTVYLFKLLAIGSYVGVSWLVWRLSEKNIWALTFFALNPIVLTEIILSGHNDAVMMFFALLSFYLLKKKKYIFSIAVLMCSILIKYATILLVPVYLYAIIKGIRKEIWVWSAILMYIAFLLSPIREEIYSWYFIWPLVFLALIPGESLLVWLSYGFTFGLPLRLAPFIYSQSWAGMTPIVKKFVTFIPPAISGLLYAYRKHVR